MVFQVEKDYQLVFKSCSFQRSKGLVALKLTTTNKVKKKQKLQDLLDLNAVRPYFSSETEKEQAKLCVKYWRTLKKTGQYDKLYTRFREPLPTSPTAGGS